MSHIVASAGVHYFKLAPPPRQWFALTELAEAVFEDGFTAAENGAQQPAAALLLVVPAQDGIRSVRAAHGEASAGHGAETQAVHVGSSSRWLAAGIAPRELAFARENFFTSGGVGPFTWTVAAGQLPPGVVLTGGHLDGTPTTAGTFTFTIKATDSAGNQATKPGSITISP